MALKLGLRFLRTSPTPVMVRRWISGLAGFLTCCGMNEFVFFFQAEDGIRDGTVTGVQTCALPIWGRFCWPRRSQQRGRFSASSLPHVIQWRGRWEEHTSELQSQFNLVCRLLLDAATPVLYPLSLHDALPIWGRFCWPRRSQQRGRFSASSLPHVIQWRGRSEERRVGKECRSRWWPYH